MTERLVQLAERNLDLLEDQMDSKDGVLTPADGERVTRAFGSVTRSIDKLKELSSSHERNAADASGAADITGSDVERRRLEIAERLERIQQRREAAERSA